MDTKARRITGEEAECFRERWASEASMFELWVMLVGFD